ncbi:MAG: hypothetical protein ABI537_01350 [Casimicrobiaceae bacterium]
MASLPCFGADVGTLTLIDGKVRMLRGTAWYNVVEGVRVREGDVVDAPEKTQFQIELTDGGALGLIGPGALYVVAASPADAKSRALDEFWVSRGWLKFDTKAPGSRLRIRSGSGTVTAGEGAAVVRIAGDAFEVFVETGAARVADGPGGEIKAVSFTSRSAGKPFVPAERAPAAFIAVMPRDFMDPLPLRAARFTTPREPMLDHEATYPEVQSWLNGPYRVAFAKRFESKLIDPAFKPIADAIGKATPDAPTVAAKPAPVPPAKVEPPKEEKKEPDRTWRWPWEKAPGK